MRVIQYISIIAIALSLCSMDEAVAQAIELDRQLIGSGYTNYDNGTDFVLTASAGESVITTISSTNLIITQGFQQSNYILSDPLVADLDVDSVACLGANDGSVSVTFVSDRLEEPLVYAWSNGQTTQSITQLEAGTYTVTVVGSNGLSITNTARVSAIDSVDCAPYFYTGITPNNDNFNDYWHIDNAEFFQSKEVQVFNRYGALIWESMEYDNFANAFVGNHQNGNPLPVGTYYFVAKFDDSNYRGWIEISK